MYNNNVIMYKNVPNDVFFLFLFFYVRICTFFKIIITNSISKAKLSLSIDWKFHLLNI